MSNFSHWEKRTEFESFIIPAKKAEAFLVTAPEICMSECRIVAEQMIRVYANENHISLKKDDGKDALMLGDFLYENKKKKYKTDFVKFLEKKNLNDVKDILKKINTKAKVYHHSNLYACISDGVEMLKQIFFCIKKLFSEKSISVGDFSEAEIQNFPKHLLRSANSKKFISPELLKFITTGDLIQAEEYINHHQNDLFSEIEGVFPLLLAIQQDDVEIVELFDKYCKDQYILFKYNLSKYDPDPMHPIFYAAKYNSRKCFDYYFETSGKINMTTQNYGRSLLMYACIGNAEEILSKLLIIPEIEIDKKDIFDSTALLYLLQTNPNSSYIKILVERGANLNVESQSRFPLMYATENNLPLFLDNGASLNEKNGVECLYFAMQYAPGSVNQIVEILKKEDTKIPWDSTAFAYACRNGMSIDFIDSFWNRIKTQSICSIEYNIRFAFKLALKKDNNIEILDYLYKLAKDNSINLVEQNIECPNIQTDDCIHSQKNLLWLLQKGFSVLSEQNSFSMHPVVVTMLFSRKTRDELWLQLNLGEIVCCKPKGKRTIIESLLYLEKIDTIDEILTSKVKISDGDSLLLLEYLVALEKNEESFKELSLKISRCINEAVKNKCITYDSILISLIKSHPPLDLNIADEFLNNGYDFSKFVCEIFPIFFLDLFVYPEEQRKYYLNDVIHAHTNSETNSEFLRYFDESSFQDVNLRLIKKAISFGANPNIQDETKKSALDYARINGIDESIFIVEQKQDVYDFSVDMPPSQKGAILGHIEINGEKVKGSIAKLLIPEGKVASDYQDQKIKVVLTSELQTKQAGEPYYKLDFAP